MKNLKTFYKTQTGSRLQEVIRPTTRFSPRQTVIYRHLVSQFFNNAVLWASKNGALQFFSDTNQKHVCWKICKVIGFSAVLRESIFHNVEWVEVCQITQFFEGNGIVKWVIFFARLCWLRDFLLKNLKLKNKLQIRGSE